MKHIPFLGGLIVIFYPKKISFNFTESTKNFNTQ